MTKETAMTTDARAFVYIPLIDILNKMTHDKANPRLPTKKKKRKSDRRTVKAM